MRCLIYLPVAILIQILIIGTTFQPEKSFAAEPSGMVEEAESEEDEAMKYAGPKGFREGKASKQSVAVYLDGEKVGTITHDDLQTLSERRIFSPRGPKKGWPVLEAIQHEGVMAAKSVYFLNAKGRKLTLEWADLNRAKDEVVLTYNFNGELILETDVSDRMPDHIQDTEEDKVREEMHKKRKRSLIFLRGINRIELTSN